MSHTGRGGIPLSFCKGGYIYILAVCPRFYTSPMCSYSLPPIIFNPDTYSPDEPATDTTDMMENTAENILTFTNAEFGSIRVVEIDNNPWFVGKDVAKVLGYSNTKDALARHVDSEDKLQNDGVVIPDPMGRTQKPTIINESGLYSLIMSSKLPTAKQFKRWVTSED